MLEARAHAAGGLLDAQKQRARGGNMQRAHRWTMKRAWKSVPVVALALALPGLAQAAPPKKPAAAPAAVGPMFALTPELEKALKSTDESQVRGALDDVKLAGKAAAPAAALLASALEAGPSPSLAEALLDTLAELEVPGTTAQILPFASHRVLATRRAAIRALVKTKGPGAAAALRKALSDPDPQVRGLSATALGAFKDSSATADLFRALDHRITEAAVSIGQICGKEDCEKLVAKLGKLPFDVVTSGLEQVFFRPTAEVPEELKVSIAQTINQMHTPESSRFLAEIARRFPKTQGPKVKTTLDAIVAQQGGAQ